MSQDKLIVVSSSDEYCYYLQWYLAADEDMGLTLGEMSEADFAEGEPPDREEWENWIAHKIASESEGVSREGGKSDYGVFYWETAKEARAVLQQIQFAWLTNVRELPDWAKKALSEGWKPPKGWKP